MEGILDMNVSECFFMPIERQGPLKVRSRLLLWAELSPQGQLEKKLTSDPMPILFFMDVLLKDSRNDKNKETNSSPPRIYAFFQIWIPKKGFSILGNEINWASRSSVKEIQLPTSGRPIYLPYHDSQKVSEAGGSEELRGAFCFPFHCIAHWSESSTPTGWHWALCQKLAPQISLTQSLDTSMLCLLLTALQETATSQSFGSVLKKEKQNLLRFESLT